MKITPILLESIYLMLCKTYPVNKWDMPPTELINFVVNNEDDVFATYLYDESEYKPHTFTISISKNGHLTTIIRSMAHECIHCSRWNTSNDAWVLHDKTFKHRAKLIAEELGFDPLEL